MKKIAIWLLALCMVLALGFAYAEEPTETPKDLDHQIDCIDAGIAWEAVMDEEDYVPATCEADGRLRKHCNNCGAYVVDEVLPKLGGHKVETDAAVEPTCTETGLTEGKSCHNMITLADGTQVKCDYVEVAQEEIDAKGHGEAEPVDPDWRPEKFDCEAGFSTPAQCSICKEELETYINVTFEHKPEVVPAVKPTCTKTGLTEGSVCSVCGKPLVKQDEVAALGHDMVAVPGTAGSCTQDAVSYHFACTRCDYKEKYTVLPAPGHKYVTVPGYAETCLTDGLTDGEQCTVCGYWKDEQEPEVIPAHKHLNDTAWETILGQQATCTEAGFAAHRKCTLCGTVQFDGKELTGEDAAAAVTIPAHGHVDEDGWMPVAVGAPAASREGDKTLLIENDKDPVNAAATCEKDGYQRALYCPWCKEVRVEAKVLPALVHDWEIAETGIVPTCLEGGISDLWVCKNCGTEKGWEIIKPLGHDMVTVPAVLATCYTAGNYEYAYCARVGCTHAEVTELDVGIMANIGDIAVTKNEKNERVGHPAAVIVAAFNHGFDADVTEYVYGVSTVVEKINPVAPTCCATGLGEGGLVCLLCEDVIVPAPVLDKIPHAWAIVEAVAETCTKNGNLKFKYCTYEGCTLGYILDKDGKESTQLIITKNDKNEMTKYPDEAVVKAPGHNPKPGTPKDPTCTQDGYTAGEYCGRCGITLKEQETVKALGHTEEIIAAVAPTCTEKGKTEGKKCSVCEETLVAPEDIPATGHTYDNYVAAVAPTCTEVGYTEGLHCSKCAPDYAKAEGWLIKPQEVPALGHAWGEAKNAKPTCEKEGYEDYKVCTVCKATDGKVIPALGHDWIEYTEEKPTCTEYGVIGARTCRTCQYTAPQQKVDPLGHNYVVVPAVAATCEKTGLTEGKKCDRCDDIAVAQKSTDALGHKMVHVDAKAPTCTEDGNKEGQKCANEGCDYKIGCETITKLDHTPTGKWVVEVEPTYGPEGQGLEVMYCSVCNHKIDARMIPALAPNRLGDANNDGAVNIVDVLVILQYDARIINTINEPNADYNGDGVVNVVDAMALLYAV